MDKEAIQNWAAAFVANCEVGGERVPLDRVIAAHLADLLRLRSTGLTWQGIPRSSQRLVAVGPTVA